MIHYKQDRLGQGDKLHDKLHYILLFKFPRFARVLSAVARSSYQLRMTIDLSNDLENFRTQVDFNIRYWSDRISAETTRHLSREGEMTDEKIAVDDRFHMGLSKVEFTPSLNHFEDITPIQINSKKNSEA
jgi:hypothetical protein